MELRDGVHTFDLEWPGMPEPLSVHVVETDGATVLFGAGDGSTADELVEVATDRGVDAVVVEHGDPDHYEGVPRLRETLDVTVAVPEGDAPTLRDAGVHPDVELEPDTAYWGVRTIDAPGHTPGNMAYRYDGVLVAGDTVVGSDSAFAAEDVGAGPLSVITADYNADDRQARASVSRLLEHAFDAVLVTHGSNVPEGGHAAVETLAGELGA